MRIEIAEDDEVDEGGRQREVADAGPEVNAADLAPDRVAGESRERERRRIVDRVEQHLQEGPDKPLLKFTRRYDKIV